MGKKIGNRTLEFEQNIYVSSYANIVGKFEGEGPLSKYFDIIENDEYYGEKTYEKAEMKLQKNALNLALQKNLMQVSSLDFICSGDLLNQCISSSYSVRDNDVPYIGLFGACSTMALSVIVSALTIEAGYSKNAAGVTSSHFCTAERQFRQPLEYGGQKPPSAQRTVTAGAAVIVSKNKSKIKLSKFTLGSVIDFLISDANNLGAAMAPAAAETLYSFFDDTQTSPNDYDLILTGDLGYVGKSILIDLMKEKGYDITNNYNDCGCMIFDKNLQDTHAGGSGCGCSGAVLTGYVLPKISHGLLRNVLFMSTGALMSPTATMQGESIPGIAHLINFEGV